MTEISMKQLLEAGVHFGHQTSRWNPKMKQYIFGARNGIYIIDLQQTVKMFRDTYDFVRDLAAQGGTIMLVGTKKQAQDIVKEEAERCAMFYVNNRWLGGMLTNFQTIRASIERLKKLEEIMADPEMIRALTKKEMSENEREHGKLMATLAGIKNMRKLPDALWVIDTKKEDIAVAEANRLGIPVAAVVDTGSRMDEVIFEEFKGTGNQQVSLDRRLLEKRIFPTIDMQRSTTRKEELLLPRSTLNRVWILRKLLSQLNAVEAMEFLIDKMQGTKTNEEFLESMNA